jgi:hypothetical protein
METKNAIFFYGSQSFLSNFYRCTFKEDDKTFTSVEQYFVYHKAVTFDKKNLDIQNKILRETNPVSVKRLGRSIRNFNEGVWKTKRLDIMQNGLLLKFRQNPKLGQLLMETGNKSLFEASPFDKIWGIGLSADTASGLSLSKYPGSNLLGKTLEDVRSILIDENQ